MNIIEASRLTGLGVTTIRRLVKDGKIRAEKVPATSPVGFSYELVSSRDEIMEAGAGVARRGRRFSGQSTKLYSVHEVAAAAGVNSDQVIYSFIARNKLPVHKNATRLFLGEAARKIVVDHYLHKHRQQLQQLQQSSQPVPAAAQDGVGRARANASYRADAAVLERLDLIVDLLAALVEAWK